VARFPLPAANGRCGLGEATFATTRGKGQDAPGSDIASAASGPLDPTDRVVRQIRAD